MAGSHEDVGVLLFEYYMDELLNMQMNNGQTIYDNRFLTHKFCSNWPGKPNHNFCSSQPRMVRT